MSLKVVNEVKVESEPCVLAWDEQLYVGLEDGSIKSFDGNLSPGVSWAAHAVQPFALAAAHGNVYSSSNDGGVRVWSTQGDKIAELPTTGADVGVLHIFGKNLYAGDEAGNVLIYENNEEKAVYNVLEEVKDLHYKPPFLFTVRDLDVTVTEIKPDDSKTRFTTRHTLEGKAPLRVVGNYLLVMDRGGTVLKLHDASIDTAFKKLFEIKASEMIISNLAAFGDFVWTAGWDGIVRRWKIVDDKLEAAGNINLGGSINGLVATASNIAYAGITGKQIFCINALCP